MDNLDLYFETHDITYLHTWVSENYKIFYSIVHSMMRKHNLHEVGYTVDDLFQEAVVAFYHVVDKFDPNLGKFTTFIYLAISNELMNILKHDERSNFGERIGAISLDEPLSNDDDSTFESIASVQQDDPMTTLLLNDLRSFVETQCNENTQTIYKLYCKGYKLEEIGKSIGLSKQRVKQILQNLTSQMQEHWGIA